MEKLTAHTYLEMIKSGAGLLYKNVSVVNDLNVFPIPDGDTGDNMFSTVNAGARTGECEGLGRMASRIAEAMLHGAKGNSGSILSRMFYGVAKGFEGLDSADINDVINAVSHGVRESYGAVETPVEGTLLSVFREAGEYARENSNGDMKKYLCDFIEGGKISLENTPEKLPCLKEAGVVDSGGAGLIYVACGMLDYLDGKGDNLPENGESTAKAEINTDLFGTDSVLEYGYCTEFLLRLQSSKVDINAFDVNEIKNGLISLGGESVVCFGDGSVIKAHVHTFTPGKILDFCQKYGEFLTLKIENMSLQHSGAKVENRFEAQRPKKRYGTVAVCAGEGLKKAFEEMGVDAVVDGGQSMNPSVDDFISAYEKINAETVFVFPNNSNVIMTAKQSAELYEKNKTVVIPTKNVGEGYIGASAIDVSEKDVNEVINAVNEAVSDVKTAFISRANRDAVSNGLEIKNGDYIGFENKDVLVSLPDRKTAALELLSKADLSRYDVMMLVCGKDVGKDERDTLEKELCALYKRTEIIRIDGGQPIYDYIFIMQ